MRDVLVVVQKGDHSLGLYDFSSGAELGRIEIDRYPHEFAVSDDGRYAYSCHFGVALAEDEGEGGSTVSIVDLPARRRVGTIDCGRHRRPHGIALDAAGAVYVLSERDGVLLRSRDPLSGAVDQVQPTGGAGSHILSVTADGALAFASNMKSGTVTALFPQEPDRPPVAIPTGARPEGSALDEARGRLYVANRESADIAVIDTERLAALGPIRTPPGAVRLCWGPEGRLLAALYHAKGLAVIDPARPAAQRFLALPDQPISVSYHPGTRAAVLSTFGDRVCVVDVDAMALRREIRTRADPDPTAVVSLPG